MSLFLEIVLLTLFDVGHHKTQYAYLLQPGLGYGWLKKENVQVLYRINIHPNIVDHSLFQAKQIYLIVY